MKKYTSIICTMAVLLMASAVTFVSCSKDEEPTVSGKFTLTVNASKGAPATKHLEEGEGNTITASWKQGEKVYVHNNTTGEDLDGHLEAQSDGVNTVLKGSLTGAIAVGNKLSLRFCSSDKYTSQQGTIGWIAENCDLATATVEVTDISTPSVTTTNAEFVNQQAIVKFTLQNMSHEDLYAQKLEVTVDGTTYTIDPEGDATANVLYVALPGFENKAVTLTATVNKDNDIYYTKTVSGITFVNGQYYTVAVGMKERCTYTAPTLNTSTVTYNGSAQSFVTAGSATNATIYYKVDYTNKSGSTSYGDWSTSVPSAINAGNYTVYYKVVPNDGYAGGVESTLLGSKTIDKAIGRCSLSSTSSSGWLGWSSKSVNVTVTNHGGSLSASKSGGGGSQNLSVSFSGSTMTLSRGSGIGSGCYDVTVTVTCAATNNYNAASATYICYE